MGVWTGEASQTGVWRVLKAWEEADGGTRIAGLLQRYGQASRSGPLLDLLKRQSTVAALEVGVKLMYGGFSYLTRKR